MAGVIAGLPYERIIALDFEFVSKPGALPVVVCLVGKDLVSGVEQRFWCEDGLPTEGPWPVDDRTLYVAYQAAAEAGCYKVLGWAEPVRVLDLFAEYTLHVNRTDPPKEIRRGLSAAMAEFGHPFWPEATKKAKQELAGRGGPWTDQERTEILDYCADDVRALEALIPDLLPEILRSTHGLGRALLRGRYVWSGVGAMEHAGVPVDAGLARRIEAAKGWMRLRLIKEADAEFGFYDAAGTFKIDRFSAYLAEEGITWPTTATGLPKTDGDTFRDMAKAHKQLGPVEQLRKTLGQLNSGPLPIGSDGRNRASIMPLGSRTGRNQPGSREFLFARAAAMRGLARPPEGRALAYLDYGGQEILIAAVLSGDADLLAAYLSGDPYVFFARAAGLMPADGTKRSHPGVRDMCKTLLLGIGYGMGARLLSARANVSLMRAQSLLRLTRWIFPAYAEWSQRVIDTGQLTGRLETSLGFKVRVTRAARPNQLRNWPIQAHGAEVLRIAVCLLVDDGFTVAAPVHDAVLLELPDDDTLEARIGRARELMIRATAIVLGPAGGGIRVDEKVVRYPDRYADDRPGAAEIWELLVRYAEEFDRTVHPRVDFGE